MTDVHRTRRSEIRLLPDLDDNDRGGALAAVVPMRGYEPLPHPPSSNSNDLGNVIPFMRPRAAVVEAPAVVLPADVARLPARNLNRDRARLLAFAALSLLVHGALFAAFWREPEPLASVGVEVMMAEIVVGATTPAGAAPTPGEQQENSPTVANEQKPDEQKPEMLTAATEQPQNVQTAPQETAPEQKTEQPKAEEQTATPQETQPAEQKPAVAMVESPNPDTATAAPREIPPDATELSLLPQPEKPLDPKTEAKPVPKPVKPKTEAKPTPKPVKAAPPKAVKNAAPAKEQRRIDAPTRERASTQAKASRPSTAANGVGIGRSDASSNYPGMVRAHLARYQRPLGSSLGTAVVSFSLGSSGAVGGVRLARASGVAAVDQEVQAMVRRASPFPAPPAGAVRNFTIPINFRH